MVYILGVQAPLHNFPLKFKALHILPFGGGSIPDSLPRGVRIHFTTVYLVGVKAFKHSSLVVVKLYLTVYFVEMKKFHHRLPCRGEGTPPQFILRKSRRLLLIHTTRLPCILYDLKFEVFVYLIYYTVVVTHIK